MAHQIEQMAYVGATPWQGLGSNLPQKQPIEVWQREVDMKMSEALVSASALDSRRQAAGFDQADLEDAARRGFGNGTFEDNEEDASAIVEEFCPEGEAPTEATISQPNLTKPSLAEKLDVQAARQNSPTDQNQGGRHAPAQAESQ